MNSGSATAGRIHLKAPAVLNGMDPWRVYRIWFYAAAAYNAGWGVVVCLCPNLLFDLLRLPRPGYPSLFQAIGMIVGVYALGYWMIARDPVRFGPFVWVGLLGKLFGPIGFALAAIQGQLPWRFGWINVTNDLIWLPAFIAFGIKLHRTDGRFGFKAKAE